MFGNKSNVSAAVAAAVARQTSYVLGLEPKPEQDRVEEVNPVADVPSEQVEEPKADTTPAPAEAPVEVVEVVEVKTEVVEAVEPEAVDWSSAADDEAFNMAFELVEGPTEEGFADLEDAFLFLHASLPTIKFDPKWGNGTGYLDGATTDEIDSLEPGTMVGFVDNHNQGQRRGILIKGCVGQHVIFERYTPGDDVNFVLVAQHPPMVEKFVRDFVGVGDTLTLEDFMMMTGLDNGVSITEAYDDLIRRVEKAVSKDGVRAERLRTYFKRRAARQQEADAAALEKAKQDQLSNQ